MLIALFTLLLLGSTPSSLLDYLDDLHNDIKAVVVDDAQRKAAVDVVRQMEKRTRDQIKMVDKQAKTLDKALAAHDLSTGDIDQMWSEYHARRRNYQLRMLDLRFELKQHVAPEAWARVFGTREEP